jgi:NAD(P)-dependent dehydrogenase (short-subunit alcohol dehydrogenase family)
LPYGLFHIFALMHKIVLITGAKGGLGMALTRKFLDQGWNVIATDLPEKINVTTPGSNLWETAMDVTSDESVRFLAGQVRKENLVLDMIINNAGIDRSFTLCEAPVEMFREVMEVNVFGSYRVNREFLPMLKKPGGRIIEISSESEKISVPFMPYPISKKFLEAYSRALRQEVKFMGIGVIIIRPGAINTPLLENVKNMRNPIPSSLLQAPFEKFASKAFKKIRKPIEPAVAAGFIFKAVTGKKIRNLYRINNDLQLSLVSLLPTRLFEWMVHRRLQ